MKWTVLPLKAAEMYCQPCCWNSDPSFSARSTSRAPWSMSWPAPRALWPTSLLPMSSQVGSPTAGPWAFTVRHRDGPTARRASTWGVAAACVALNSSFTSFSPHPSKMHTSTGRPVGNRPWGFSCHSGGTDILQTKQKEPAKGHGI
jgi:hypothetical protein